jgi:hypothetical protein
MDESGLAASDLQGEEWLTIGNEFALVRVRKVYTRNGQRLQIQSPKMSHEILLDPVELESLTWQSHDTFSGFLQSPFGPPAGSDDAPTGRPTDA